MSASWEGGGLFSCTNDIGGCLYGLLCPICVYGATDDIINGGGCVTPALMFYCCTPCVLCCVAPGRRKKLRESLGGLPEEPCNDCVAWVCCPNCANCEEARELAKRGVSNNNEFQSLAANTQTAANEAAGVAA